MQLLLLVFSFTIFHSPSLVLADLKGTSLLGTTCTDRNGLVGTCQHIVDKSCSHVLHLKLQGWKYAKCGFEDHREIVCCARRVIKDTVVVADVSKRYMQECEKYKKNMFDKEVTFIRPTAGALPNNFTISTCSQYTFPLVVDGENALPKEFPHMALLGCKDKNGAPKWKCGGTLISLNYVLTAAHCFEFEDNDCEDLTIVRLGDLNIKTDTDDAQPVDFNIILPHIPHPEYNSSLKYNDIALVKLDKDITMNAYIRPACLPYENYNNISQLIITGWGQKQFAGSTADHLQKANVEEFSYDKCIEAHTVSEKLPSGVKIRTQICAGSTQSDKDTCQGDSGGPLQAIHPSYPCMYTIIGITSTGQGCGHKGVPAVYTRVFYYNDWIESIVWR